MGAGPERGIPAIRGRSPHGLPGSPWRGRRAFPAAACSHLRLLRNMRGWRPRPPGPGLSRSGPLATPVGRSVGFFSRGKGACSRVWEAARRPPAASSSSVPLPPPHLQHRHKAKAGHRCANTEHLPCQARTAAAGERGAWRGLIHAGSQSLAGNH